jgi:3-phosphoshikimate 1-carboxyvinyltransferase
MQDPLPIAPATRPLDATVTLPGSKSITNRALLLAALADGESRLTGALFSEDTHHMAAALYRLGLQVMAEPAAEAYTVTGGGGAIPNTGADLFVGNSGTTARFLTAFLALGHGTYRLDGVARMRQRPIGDLLSALRKLGVDAASEQNNDCPPLLIRAEGLRGGAVRMRADVSSQFLSALLMVAPLAENDVQITLEGELASVPYIAMTLTMMRQWGVTVLEENFKRFVIPGGQTYRARSYAIEPDASGASYFFAAAAVTGGCVRVEGLGRDSIQGDTAFVDVLARMGCRVTKTARTLEVCGSTDGVLQGIDVNMNAISDTVMTLAAIAPFADRPTRIQNVAHIRHKETDRIAALVTELTRLGVHVQEQPDGLTIYPAALPLNPAVIETYQDHRMAMSFAVTALRSPGIAIADPACVGKTFPDFFTRFARLFDTAEAPNGEA